MARTALTDDIILRASADPAGLREKLPCYLWDTTQRGFAARVSPEGKITFVFKVVVAKSPIWENLGVFPDITLEKARDKARIFKQAVDDGKYPSKHKLKPIRWKALVTKFEDSHYEGLAKKTVDNYKSVVTLHIKPAFENKMAHMITHLDVKLLYVSMSKKPRQANVVLGLIKKIFDFAEGCDHIEMMTNPVVKLEKLSLRKYEENARDRYITTEEMEKLAKALKTMEKEGWKQFTDIFKVAYIMGGRISEVLGMRWDSIDVEKQIIDWEESKTGEIQKVLTDALFEVISKIDRLDESPFVFPSFSGSESGHVVDLKRPWKRMLELAQVHNLTRHDLRHNFGNEAADMNMCLQQVSVLLGHKNVESSGRYSKHKNPNTINRRANKLSGRLANKLKA